MILAAIATAAAQPWYRTCGAGRGCAGYRGHLRKEAFAMQGAARRKMIVAFILMLEAIIFFVLYSQMPTSLNFFAIRNVEHSITGIAFEPEQYQALNPFWIMIGSPILAAIYNKMGDRLPMPHKFAIGMVLCSVRSRCCRWVRNLRPTPVSSP